MVHYGYAVFVLGLTIVSSLSVEDNIKILESNGKIIFGEKSISLWMSNPKGDLSERRISVTDTALGLPHVIANYENHLIMRWKSGVQMTIHQELREKINAYQIEIMSSNSNVSLKSCVDLGNANWYGGAETYHQGWPIQDNDIVDVDFVPNERNGGVMDRYFLNSLGESFYHNATEPLFVSLSTATKELCFICAFKAPYRNTDGRQLTMNSYEVMADDMLSAHRYSLDNYFARPASIPSEQVFRDPIWSTWAQYKAAINQTTVLDFSQQIEDNGFPISQIEIDDNWETCYGNEEFDTTKFPDAAGMVSTLNQRGHNVTLWVHPFVNLNCDLFKIGDDNHYFVTSGGENVTGVTHWWDGVAGIIDVTKTEAANWWFNRLDVLRSQVGIAAFKFDAGETRWLPPDAYLNSSEDVQPGIYSTLYAQFANQFGGRVEARVGYRSEDVSIFIRMLDRDSTWGLNNGLHSVLTSTLHMGLVGSPFVLPDYIGGNGYGGIIPDRELFVRWVELTAFLPVMQFSYTPWSYDEEIVNISRRMVDLHQNISDVIITAAHQSMVDGSPIIRPLWWISPNDATAQQVNDQFMVGDTYLVAPIVEKGATQRDVYLPVGNWSDQLRGSVIVGPTWLRNYTVELSEISYFTYLH